MNLILFEEGELPAPLPSSDPRAVHLKKVLRREAFEEFDAGIVNGPRGKARITGESVSGFSLDFTPSPDQTQAQQAPLILAAGAVRPQTARKILREITALGVQEIWFFGTEKGEKTYLQASIYKEESYRPQLIEGTQQAFCTRLPEVRIFNSLGEAVKALPAGKQIDGIALDNYEAETSLKSHLTATPSPEMRVIWIGSERGWSERERACFRETGIRLLSMGDRVLRTETAAAAAVSICLYHSGFLE